MRIQVVGKWPEYKGSLSLRLHEPYFKPIAALPICVLRHVVSLGPVPLKRLPPAISEKKPSKNM